MVAVSRGDGSLWLMGILPGTLVPGGTYAVLGPRGVALSVTASPVEHTDDQCDGFYYDRATIQTAWPEDLENPAVAIGPIGAGTRAVRTGEPDRATAPQVPDSGGTWRLYVASDGGTVPDRALTINPGACGGGAGVAGGTICFQEWRRTGAAWQIARQVTMPCR